VSPAWQRSGLGRAMIERLTNQLVQDGISTITLYAEPQVGSVCMPCWRLKYASVTCRFVATGMLQGTACLAALLI
jgi:hypothetical protein